MSLEPDDPVTVPPEIGDLPEEVVAVVRFVLELEHGQRWARRHIRHLELHTKDLEDRLTEAEDREQTQGELLTQTQADLADLRARVTVLEAVTHYATHARVTFGQVSKRPRS